MSFQILVLLCDGLGTWLTSLCFSPYSPGCDSVTVISDPTEHCDGKSMKHQLLLWGFQVDGIAWSCLITTVHSKAFSPQSTRTRAEIPKIRHCSAKGILCWRLQLPSLNWNINAGLLFVWSSCCYGELQTGLCCLSFLHRKQEKCRGQCRPLLKIILIRGG